MKPKAIIFDKDGVLADSEKLKATAWQQTLEPLGVQDGYGWYLRELGPSSVALATLAMETFSLDGDPEAIAQEWDHRYRAIEGAAEPIRDNLEILAHLSQGYAIAVASSMDQTSIVAELMRFGYRDYVEACVSGEDVANNKPAPDVYIKAAACLGVEPAECVAVEDSPTGVRAAKDAGIYCVGFKNPLYDLDLSEADLIATDLTRVDFANLLDS